MTPATQSRDLLAPTDHSLTIIVARDISGLSTEFDAWTRAGLLRPVVICGRDELALSTADVRCETNVRGTWSEMELSDALRQIPMQALTVAALRPSTPAEIAKSAPGLENEVSVLQHLQERFRNMGAEFRSLTVSVHDATTSVAHEAFSPRFDMHLIHDADSIAHHRLPAENVVHSLEIEGRLTLCAMTALTMSGAWRFSRGHLIEADRGDAAVNSVRIVRPQVRVVFGGRLLREASTGLLPLAPPWPMPSGSGAVRAQAGAVPPLQVAEAMCERLGLEFTEFDAEPLPRVSLPDRLRAAWHSLTHEIAPPVETTADERALEGLRDQLAAGRWKGQGKHQADPVALRRHLDRAGLPDLVGGAPPDPVRWDNLREFAICLVDGGEPSDEVARQFEFPVDRECMRLVWNDPNSIIAADPLAESDDRSNGQPTTANDEALLNTATEDNLFRRLRNRLDSELHRAADRCSGTARTPEQELETYEKASSHSGRLQRVRNIVASLVLLAALVVIERWVGVVGALTDLIGIGTIGGKTSSPIVDILVGVVVSLLALISLSIAAWWAGIAALKHYDAQRLRRWSAESGRHHAAEAARLCAASIEFDDHAEIIAAMLHRPYSTGQPSANGRIEVDTLPHPFPMMIAAASPLPERVATLRRRGRTATVASGWIGGIFASALDRWRQDYAAAVAGPFDHPDADHTPPGFATHRDARSNEPLLGPREHFARAIKDDDGLRREITSNAIGDMLSSNLPADANSRGPTRRLTELLGAVTVPSARALDGLAVADFLNLSEEPIGLNWEILRPGSKPPGQHPLGHQVPIEIPEGPGHPETLIASWRVVISDPFSPTDLSAWAPGDSAISVERAEPGAPSVV